MRGAIILKITESINNKEYNDVDKNRLTKKKRGPKMWWFNGIIKLSKRQLHRPETRQRFITDTNYITFLYIPIHESIC